MDSLKNVVLLPNGLPISNPEFCNTHQQLFPVSLPLFSPYLFPRYKKRIFNSISLEVCTMYIIQCTYLKKNLTEFSQHDFSLVSARSTILYLYIYFLQARAMSREKSRRPLYRNNCPHKYVVGAHTHTHSGGSAFCFARGSKV